MAIPDHYTTQWGKNFTAVSQQMQSRFRKAAMVETGCTGEAKTHNLVQSIEDNETTGDRYGRVVLRDLDTEKRWIRPRMFDNSTSEPKWDEELLAPTILPGGKHLEAHTAAYARRLDRVFVDALLGDNYKGKAGTTVTNIPAANNVAIDFVSSGSATSSSLTIDKIIQGIGILQDNESYGDDAESRGISLWGAMTPLMERTLLWAANAATGNRLFSKDFMPPVLDEKGRIKFFLGVNWIRSSQLPYDTPTASGAAARYAALWTSDAMYLDFWQEQQSYVDILPEAKRAVLYFSQYAFNGVRSEDLKVVKIACTPT